MSLSEPTNATVISSAPLVGEPNTQVSVAVKNAVKTFDANAQEVRFGVKALAAVRITNPEDREAAYQLVKLANKSKLLIEKTLKLVLAPYKEITDAIKAYAKDDLVYPLQTAIDKVDSIILIFDAEEKVRKEAKLKELEADRLRIAEAAAADQKKIDDAKAAAIAQVNSGDFAERQVKISAMPPGILRIKAQNELNALKAGTVAKIEEVAAAASQEARIDKGIALSDVRGVEEDLSAKTKGAMLVWRWEVADFSQVADPFKMIDESSVRAAIKLGAQSIRGLKMWQEDKLRH